MADLSTRELDAAGIAGTQLRDAYLHSRALHASHGRSYFLATRLLSPARRPSVYALYGFARHVDEIVDAQPDHRCPAQKATALNELDAALDRAIACVDNPDPDQEQVLTSVAHTATRHALDRTLFDAFLASMRMDIEVTEYPSHAALRRYMHGSAGVIGLQMLPVLGTVGPLADAAPAAESLGIAFQLTNFLRDVGEDLDRGRVYLPADELAAFGVDRALLTWCRRNRRSDPRVRRVLAHLVASTREVYREAESGIELLIPESRPCLRTAYALYAAILDRIVAADYDVLHRRVAVSRRRRIALAAPALLRAYSIRRTRRDRVASG
jgi:15-cis-phytoene synthase